MGLGKEFHELFKGSERVYGTYDISGSTPNAEGKLKGKARTVHAPVTDDLWDKHLSGSIPGIGLVPINDDNECLWGAIDVDVYTIDHVDLEERTRECSAPLLVCRTKSGGAHLYMFCSEPVKAALIRLRLKECAAAMGIYEIIRRDDPRKDLEIFPKQIDLAKGETPDGNWINMPYQNAKYTTRYCVRNGKAALAEEFLEIAKGMRLSAKQLQELKPKKREIKTGSGSEWEEGPPCLERLVKEGFPEGSRNNALFSLGVYARKRYENWPDKVAEYNAKWMTGTFSEVAGIVKSLEKKDYKYKCNDAPLCIVCNKEICYGRKYGITNGEDRRRVGRPRNSDEDVPCVLEEVDRPVKVYRPPEGSGDEPQWLFIVTGHKMDVTLDMLLNQRLFLKEYAKQFERLRPEVNQVRWMEKVNELLAEAEVLGLPSDVGPEGQLMLHLEAFCTGKVQAIDKAELLLGRPWTDENGITWFRSKDFVKFLDQQHFREFKQKEFYAVFRRHGCKHDTLTLKGVCVAVWGLPGFKTQKEAFDPVEVLVADEEAPF